MPILRFMHNSNTKYMYMSLVELKTSSATANLGKMHFNISIDIDWFMLMILTFQLPVFMCKYWTTLIKIYLSIFENRIKIACFNASCCFIIEYFFQRTDDDDVLTTNYHSLRPLCHASCPYRVLYHLLCGKSIKLIIFCLEAALFTFVVSCFLTRLQSMCSNVFLVQFFINLIIGG